jgi:5,10-methylene-tetrahydrofolate dehydrogenase/methenyl tetrahydrofolate cyclohydrolase
MEILRRAGVPLRGKRALVIGRSNIVGMPMSLMLTRADATVQVATSHTPPDQLEEALKASDIVVASAGSPGLVKGEWIKEGATVIDVGINAVDDASKKAGYRLVGDVAFEQAKGRAGLITPVPGGVGPMTIAMLMRNTVNVAKLQMEARRAEAA